MNNLKIISLNIFSFLPHIDELRILAADKRPHIIGIQETKLDSTVENSDINTDKYSIIRNDRNLNGGGVALYIHNSLVFKNFDEISDPNVESVSAKIKVGNYKPFIVTCLYRPPDKPVSHLMILKLLLLQLIMKTWSQSLLGTQTDYFDKSANDTSHLLKIINTFNLKQVISDYTRITATTKTCIDHFITNRPVCVLDSGVLPCGISDHDAFFMVKNMRAPKLKLPPQSLSVRNYKKFDTQAFRNDIENLPFDQIKNVSQDANEMLLIWKSFFIDTLNKHAPVTKITAQNNRLPSDLKKLLRQRDYLRGKANKTGSKYLRQALQQVRASEEPILN